MTIPRTIRHDCDAPVHPAIVRLIADYPLAWVVSGNGAATPLPLLGDYDGEGRLRSLLGHFSRANPQLAALEADDRATILFSGPDGYVSPRHVSDPAWAPTWNYAVARFRCRIRLLPDEADVALGRLTAAMEAADGGGWTVERMGPRYGAMRTRILAFRAEVLDGEASFKLGQEERASDFATIVAGLPDAELVEWMVRARG